ncbi:CNP1-like family protein [Azonexus fungiphilus]|uniref:CNP1-like family protein n=1 Tax=Azonexus fungiphilus TaxID=146940 RepID=UPI0020C48853|nr:CNP1-like family protein [Azonexus fungiphilus]
MNHRLVRGMLLAALAFAAVGASAQSRESLSDEPVQWQEQAVSMPPAPRREALLPFYVSATTSNRFFVDSASLTVDGDGVVRYVLLVETAGGAVNTTFEGMRCETRERKIYATGRRDGSWTKSRNEAWEKIRDIAPNRQHAALFIEHFCPGGVIVRHAGEALEALRRGGHPSLQMVN